MNRPLFTHRGVTFQDFFIGPNYIEMDINVTSATADHAGGYGLDDPSTYTDLIFSAGEQFVVQKTTIAEFETSEAVLASAQLNFIKFTEGNLIDLDSHNAEDPEDTQ
ncbi:MAG: hypothetical protein B0D91_08845 [Oceanospirillales bacterium LUC14_002_19_P2]|nr:MAG: hypothetical protein B0D91_08845 [Oceanospirillales bacterium LUC14_002_19_P2]